MSVVVLKREGLKVREVEGKKYYLWTVGSEDHWRPTYRIWVSQKLVEEDEEGRAWLVLPKRGVKIERGKKDLILKEGDYNLFGFYVFCGYRGGSSYKILSHVDFEYPFYVYRSERGSLGISDGALVLTKEDRVRIRWERTGRTYGQPKEGFTVIYLDGRVEEIEGELPEV